MAKNEAKIKFTAETGSFNSAISKANSAMTELRAELKLNETQMKATGTSVEGLQKKHDLLQAELSAAREKTEALSQKLSVAVKYFGENSTEAGKLRTQLANAKTAEVNLQKAVDDCADELKDQQKQTKNSEEGLEKLKKATDDASDGFEKMKTGLSNISGVLGKVGGAVGGAVKTIGTTVAGIGTAISGAVVATAESTREYRTEMGKLDAAFAASGLSADSATSAYSKLYGVIGETDQSVEAAQQIALLANSEREVANWAELASGVVGKFGDALQPETFFESANETIKLGEATGAYAQMLEGCGISVEDFNEGLALCQTESQRQSYALRIAKQALGEAGEQYQKNNADIIASNEATNRFTEAMATFGAKAEPILTAVKDGFAKVLETAGSFLSGFDASGISAAISGAFDWFISNAVPAIQAGIQWVIDNKEAFANFFSGVGDLISTAFTWFVDNALPVITDAIEWVINNKDLVLGLISGIAAGFAAWNIVQIVSGAISAFKSFKTTIDLVRTGQVALNAVLGMNPLGIIITVIAAVVAAFIYLWNNCESFRNFWINLWENIKKVFGAVCDWLIGAVKAIWEGIKVAWEGIKTAVTTAVNAVKQVVTTVWNAIKNAITTVVNGIKTVVTNVWNAIKSAVSNAVNAIKTVVSNVWNGIKTAITNVVNGIKNGISNAWNAIKNTTSNIFNGIKNTVSNIWNSITNIFSNAWNGMKNIGKNIVEGLWNGIKGAGSWLWDKITGFGNDILGWFKGIFGIHSPSTETAWQGEMMVAGYVEALKNGRKEMASAVEGLANAGLNSFDFNVNAHGTVNGLQSHISDAAEKKAGALNLQALANAIEDLANRPISLNINGRQFALATAGDGDSVNGLRSTFKSRGLVLD